MCLYHTQVSKYQISLIFHLNISLFFQLGWELYFNLFLLWPLPEKTILRIENSSRYFPVVAAAQLGWRVSAQLPISNRRKIESYLSSFLLFNVDSKTLQDFIKNTALRTRENEENLTGEENSSQEQRRRKGNDKTTRTPEKRRKTGKKSSNAMRKEVTKYIVDEAADKSEDEEGDEDGEEEEDEETEEWDGESKPKSKRKRKDL